MRLASPLVLLPALFALFVPAAPVAASSPNIVIGEFRIRGPNGASDEFIEIYNLSGTTVNLGSWKVNGSNSSGSISTRATIPANTFLNPGCHYLLANDSPSGYSGGVAPDQTYTTGITDDGGIALLNPVSVVVDQVGMSVGSTYKEGTVLTPLTTDTNRSYERLPGGIGGNGQDLDDNASDFFVASPSNPQNRASICVAATPATSETWGRVKILYR